jgi:cell division protein FtsN
VEALLSSLEDSGYPTRVQTYPDEAGETWYRGLVGPFSTRARAQAAARQLLRERDLQAWVTEIGASR